MKFLLSAASSRSGIMGALRPDMNIEILIIRVTASERARVADPHVGGHNLKFLN